MAREQKYRNKRTGEYTTSHRDAVEWYRNKDEVEVWYFSNTLRIWVIGVEWVF